MTCSDLGQVVHLAAEYYFLTNLAKTGAKMIASKSKFPNMFWQVRDYPRYYASAVFRVT